MGYGWELQAGALLVVENGEFRFRDKIKLTDEGGSVTDTYTFDAFGNLTIGTRRREQPINLSQIPCFQEAGDFFQKQDLKNFV